MSQFCSVKFKAHFIVKNLVLTLDHSLIIINQDNFTHWKLKRVSVVLYIFLQIATKIVNVHQNTSGYRVNLWSIPFKTYAKTYIEFYLFNDTLYFQSGKKSFKI